MRKISHIALLCLLSLTTKAQSIHYSQYNDFVSMLNPAMTGASTQYDYVVGVVNRSQWREIPAHYQTFGANADASVYLGTKYENGWFGFGASWVNDVAGDGKLRNQRLQTNLAFHQKIQDKHLLSVGVTAGIDNLSLDHLPLKFASQWDGGSYNLTLPNGEPIDEANLQYNYFNMGINYSLLTESLSLNVGYAMHNINKPVPSFLGNYSPIALRHLVTTQAAIQAGDQFIVRPLFNMSMQANAREVVIGSGVHYNFTPGKMQHAVYTGLNVRLGDAVIPYMGYEENNWKVIFSYDVTVSGLAPYNGSKGAFELGLVIHSTYPRGNKMKEKLICPRF